MGIRNMLTPHDQEDAVESLVDMAYLRSCCACAGTQVAPFELLESLRGVAPGLQAVGH
jgi:hypothetical protein